MAISRSIAREDWQTFFDRVSGALVGKRAEVEAASLELGDQIVAEWVPVLGISYDPKDDLLDLALEGLDHLVRSPRQISLWEGDHGIETIGILTGDGMKQTLRLKDPLMLPAPPRATV